MNVKYDITAKAAGGATLGQKELMPLLQTRLVDRFKLKTHFEPREMALYDLVIARSDGRLGPELKPSTSDRSDADELNAKRAEAAAQGDLAAIVPKPGEFLTCTIAPSVAGGPANLSMHDDGQEMKTLVDGSSLLTALNEQLGLKLESSRGPVDVLIVDSVEAPTPD